MSMYTTLPGSRIVVPRRPCGEDLSQTWSLCYSNLVIRALTVSSLDLQ